MTFTELNNKMNYIEMFIEEFAGATCCESSFCVNSCKSLKYVRTLLPPSDDENENYELETISVSHFE